LKDVTFYHQDALGSVVMLTGHNGQVVERYEYDVYGVAYNGKFDHGLAGMGGNSYGFTGKRYEQEMGVYSFAFRDYNPRSMRWMTEDPIKDEVNWYQYCGSDPVNWVDFTGLWGKEIHYGSKEYGGTLQWAQDVGFTEKEATIIAKADQNVDSPSSGKCPLPVIGDQRYHFNTNRDVESGSIGDSRKVVAEEHLQKAIDLQNEANALRDSKKGSVLNIIGDAVKENKAGKLENNALQELGTGLHSIQDMSAHKDVFVEEGSILGVDYLHHLGEKGKEADDPGHPQSPNERYYQALNDTKAYLQRFKEETECK
jgi:RHS repeat-associated protein